MTSPNREAEKPKAEAVPVVLTEKDQKTKTVNSKNHPIQIQASDLGAQTVKISNQNPLETKKISSQGAIVILNREMKNLKASNLEIENLNQRTHHPKAANVILNQEKAAQEITNPEQETEISNRKMAARETSNQEQETEILNKKKVAQEIINQEQANGISNLRMEIREILNRELVKGISKQKKAATKILKREAAEMTTLNQVQEAQEM